MCKDIQAFSRSLRRVVLSRPTGGVSDTQIQAMALAIHNSRTDKMDYRFKDDMPREHWLYYDSFLLSQSSDKIRATYGIMYAVGMSDYDISGIQQNDEQGDRGQSKKIEKTGESSDASGTVDASAIGCDEGVAQNPDHTSSGKADAPASTKGSCALSTQTAKRRGSTVGRKAAKHAKVMDDRARARATVERSIAESTKKKAD